MNELLTQFEGIAANLESLCKSAQQLQGLNERLGRIEELLAAKRTHVNEKPFLTPKELANLTTDHGAIKYSYFTLRQACNHGRIDGAFKQPYNKQWLIPQETAQLILSEGLPCD